MTRHAALSWLLAAVFSVAWPSAAAKGPAQVGAQSHAAVEGSALIVATEEATLSAPMPGRILRVEPGLGQAFRAGQTLVEFDCSEARARLDVLRAEHEAAAQTHLARIRLQGLGAASELEVVLAASALDRAAAQLRQQEAQLTACRIEAPFDGRVVRVRARTAESVAAYQPLLEVIGVSRLKATVYAPVAQAGAIRHGDPLQIEVRETGRVHRARVVRRNARVDGASQSLEIEAEIVAPAPGLMPGMVGTARFGAWPGGAR